MMMMIDDDDVVVALFYYLHTRENPSVEERKHWHDDTLITFLATALM